MIGHSNGVNASALIRPEGREPEVVAFETAVVSFFLDAAEILGIPKSLAVIYGICFASEEPLSFADIEQKLSISKGSISQGLRVLREVGALKVWVASAPLVSGLPDDALATASPGPALSLSKENLVQRGTRPRERFEPDIELRKLILHYLEQRVEKQLEAGKKRIREIKAATPRSESKTIIARVKSLEGWHTKSRALLPMIKGALRLT